MPKGKWIDKKTAQHFTLVHRPQNDPRIHDSDAPPMVLNPTTAPNSHKVKKLDDLASELGSDAAAVRANEGEAANYGVYFDDTEYDYMQHLRDLNSSSAGGEVVFVEAKPSSRSKDKGKGKQKQSLDDALRQLDIEDAERKKRELLDDDILPSKNLTRLTYQAQQDVPDAIGRFQPDMDPRLREVLEALEDEAYVDDDDEIFQELAKEGQELDDFEFEEQGDFFDDDDEDGWESDDTAKPKREYKTAARGADEEAPTLVPVPGSGSGEEVPAPNENWLDDFKQFKKDQKVRSSEKKKKTALPPPSNSDLQSSLFTTTTNGGLRRKKRKGALTSQSGYSMTSSSLVRTEQLGILDERFEKLEERHYNPAHEDGEDDFLYGDDDGTASALSGITGITGASTASSVTGPTRGDFDSILDDFLGGYSMHGKKQLKKGGWKNGAEQLDDIRRELGPPRLKGKYAGGGGKTKSPAAAAALTFGAPSASR
ncbi:hypothetical protein DL770_010928 [Monosporascus sp. CRB-9-2]|nr:hypothetical protein DL770_010928 [Monosporascus sp. CRB-9-2]